MSFSPYQLNLEIHSKENPVAVTLVGLREKQQKTGMKCTS